LFILPQRPYTWEKPLRQKTDRLNRSSFARPPKGFRVRCILGRLYTLCLAAPAVFGNMLSHYIIVFFGCQAYWEILTTFTFTPGPMVGAKVMLLKYCPFRLLGRALLMASIRVWKLSANCSSVKEAFPIGTWIMFVLSNLYSILPALISLTALVTSMVTVPDLGLGIRPLGPSTRPRRPTTPIMSGVATTTSKSSHPSF